MWQIIKRLIPGLSPLQWAAVGAVVLAAYTAGVAWVVRDYVITSRVADEQAALITAMEAARKDEQAKQQEVNNAIQTQADNLAAINDRLRADIDRLRSRPDRLPEAARADCQGATGAELSRSDAAFLAGEAARADRIREALRACYRYADTVTGKPTPTSSSDGTD